MPSLLLSRWLLGACALVPAVLVFTPFTPPADARGEDKPATPAAATGQSVSYLKEVRPILAQHCFGCHGPDEAARKGKLRLDLKDAAFAERKGRHVIAPRDLDDSLVWERIVTEEPDKRMPPDDGKSQPLSKKQIATLKSWIEQGAKWEDHWSFVAPVKPPVPRVSNKGWVRDPIDAFILARLEREGIKPEGEATREAWLRRVSFDLTGLPPTPAELDDFLKDKAADAYEKQVDRLLKSPRYGERQAQEWLDLARYADTGGYQNDSPRSIWKWREWVINAYNANMPFDRFTIEQLAGDLLPNPTLAQRIATGFNRNHPTNSEAGEEEDEYRSVYVIDRVSTTATVFMGLTMACVQCHDHKYDPISQKDFYSFYSFFNNIKERDSDFRNPRPSIPVPNPDQEPRLADLKARIAVLKQRLEREDPITDSAQREWEGKVLARIGDPVAWTTVRPTAMLSRNGAELRQLDDGSVLSAGAAPVKDVYDVMIRPGKKRIAALRLEVLPHDSQPEKATGRATDGRFSLSALEVRHTTFSDSQDPPLVYITKAEADINQKSKEEPTAFDMFPGPIESAIVVDSPGGGGGGFFRGGGWSIVGEERKKPHEAVLLPLEPIETNDASVIRISLHQTGGRFKSLIGRFRLSYTEDDRVREVLLPALPKLWSSIGPFPAEDAAKAYSTAFDPEKDIKSGEPLDLKKPYPKPAPPASTPDGGKDGKGGPPMFGGKGKGKGGFSKGGGAAGEPASAPATAPAPKSKDDEKTEAPKAEKIEKAVKPIPKATDGGKDEATAKKADKGEAKPTDKTADKPDDKADGKDDASAKKGKARPETITWTEQRTWRDGSPTRLQGTNAAFYVTRTITSTRARTATVQIDGPAGFKLWVNGEPVQSSPPPPPPPAPAAPPKKAGGPDEPPPEPDFDNIDIDMLLGRSRSRTEKKFRIGLREGENEIVVKVVFAGGGSGGRASFAVMGGPPMGGPGGGGAFTFNFTPEGEDVINHEVATALRQEATARARAALPTAPAPRAVERPAAAQPVPGVSDREANAPAEVAAITAIDPTKPPAKKASLVGEIAAPNRYDETEDDKLTPAERRQKVLREFYRSRIDPVGRVVAEELAKLKEEERDLKRQMPETLVMEEMDKPRQAYIFLRGLYKSRGEDVDPGTPGVLPPMPADLPRNRLGLAKWLVSPQHPLTARVLVNRIWQQYFGLGLVRTAEDFGIRGELPSHPELLDHLATEMIAGGWDLKKFHKRIVLSATYRQASAASPEALERDPENRLLARGPRLRLTAEMVRDNALSISGLLFEKVGGESVKPVQPKNAWKTVDGFGGGYRRDTGEKQYRRALYVYWKRGSPYPSMMNFDAVKRDACTVTRATTTTPLQALTLLNDPAYVECAKMLGQRMLKDREAIGRAKNLPRAEEDAKRLAYGFRLCTSRAPTDKEVEILRGLLDDQRAHFQADTAAAKKLLAVGDAKTDDKLDPAEAAAWAGVGNALLNLDATINR